MKSADYQGLVPTCRGVFVASTGLPQLENVADNELDLDSPLDLTIYYDMVDSRTWIHVKDSLVKPRTILCGNSFGETNPLHLPSHIHVQTITGDILVAKVRAQVFGLYDQTLHSRSCINIKH